MLLSSEDISNNKINQTYFNKEKSIQFINEENEERKPKNDRKIILHKIQSDKSIAQKISEPREFKNAYACCSSDSERKRLRRINISRLKRHLDICHKIEVKNSKYLLNYHPHEFKDPNVKYYNPRKGLETIDGFKYNSMFQANSSLKEIQYEFHFKFLRSIFNLKKWKKEKAKIELASVFDANEMQQLANYFNENKEYRHQRKIKYKDFFNQEVYIQNKSNYHKIIENLKGIVYKRGYSDKSAYGAFFYTDALTALSILAEKTIYPSVITAGLNNIKNPKTFQTAVIGLLREPFKPNSPDSFLRLEMDNIYWKNLYENSNPKFNKLEYCFGFKFKDIYNKLPNQMLLLGLDCSTMYECKEKINLKKVKFILVKRQFKNCLLYKGC